MAKYAFPALALALASFAASSSSNTVAFVPSSRNVALTSRDAAPPATTTPRALRMSSETPLAPLTVWGDPIPDVRSAQESLRRRPPPPFAPEIRASDLGLDGDVEAQLRYFEGSSSYLKRTMEECGAVVFRGFDLMKTQEGFQSMYGALGMKVCLDPLHSVSARPTVDGKKGSPVYEAVNKESRKNFFIGMHNEFVGTRAPRAAAFVCFKAAETGGEFLIADGRAVFRDLNPDLLERMYRRGIRYSVMELPFFGWMDGLPGAVRGPLMAGIKGLVGAAINAKVDFDVDLRWGEGGYDGVRMLQARAPSQPPVVVHPATGDPTWFCNVHSHSSKLRRDRESVYGAERFEDGASQINKSDVYYGDDGDLTNEDLRHMDEVTTKNVRYVKMSEGDVVLLDNYKCMHGRNVFDGTRKHGVAWFGGWEGEEEEMRDGVIEEEGEKVTMA